MTIDHGTCGTNLNWSLGDDYVLTITGSGAMKNYTTSGGNRPPWYSYRTRIVAVVFTSLITSIGTYAFYGCSAITSITIPDNVSDINTYAFRGCRSLASVTFGTGLRTIQTGAFQGCAITTISIPALVTTLSQSAFRDCSALTAINVDGDNTNYSSADGVLFDKNKTVLMQYPAAKSGTSYTVPNGVVTVYDCSFQKCALLTSVVISDSVTTLGAAAFDSCASLTSITIGSAVSSIGGTGLYDPNPFGGCTSLAEFIVSENNEYFSSADGVLLSKDGSTLFKYPMGKADTSYTIPDSVTAIHAYAFASCTGLTSITIGNNVESIGNYAFDSCASLMSISIPDSVTSIDDGAFFYCESLTSITIGSAVSSIGSDAFYGCSSVTTIELQSVPASIGQDAFSMGTYSSPVTCIVYSPNNIANGVLDDYKGYDTTLVYLAPGEFADDDWTYKLEEFGGVQKAIITSYIGHNNCIIIPSTVGTGGNSGGSGSGGDDVLITRGAVIEPVEPVEPTEPVEPIEYTVVQLGSGDAPVFSTASIQSLTIPNTVKFIADRACLYATYGAGRVAYLRIEGNVESIGDNAFANCTGLKEIQFMGSTPCDNIAGSAFSLGSPALGTANCTIYSPNNWAQDKINNSIYGTLTFKTLDTTRRYNPLSKLRYSYAEGTIPDFNIDFGVDIDNEEGSLTIHVGNQELYIGLAQDMEQRILDNPSYPSIMMAYIFACENKIVTLLEGFMLLTANDDHTLSYPEAVGFFGNISCENGTITLTFNDGNGTTSTTTFDAPEWCYYPDENGEYGWYDLTMFGSGLYVDESPICPGCLYIDYTLEQMFIFYQDSYLSFEEPLAEPPTLVKTVVNDVMTDIHWTSDGDIYPTGVYLAPLSLPGNAPVELPPLEIPIAYTPSTRRISVPKGYDMYGGATTDVNSVKLVFSGIVPAGENFIARVDFAVPVKVDEYTIERPFILLEQNEDKWSAVIPNAVLAATRDTHKLPLQLILANDSQIVNSRNTIILETSLGIESAIPGNELPTYEMPEWPLPTGVSESIDVHTVNVTYNPATRMLTASRDPYGGTTIDTLSVRINITGIEPIGTDFGARLDFAAPIRIDEESVIKPFVVLEQIGTVYSAMIPQAVLMAAKETKKLPFQLVTRHGDIIVNSRNTIVLEITRAINAMETVEQAYTPYVMYRNDTWEWLPDYTYGVGAIVLYGGKLFASTAPNNLGNTPFKGSEYWTMVSSNIGDVILDDIVGTKDDDGNVSFTSAQVFTAAGFTKTPVTVTELDVPVCSYEFPVESYTNEGHPLIEALHFGNLITGNDKFVMTNYDYGNDRRTANIYLYKYYGNEDRYDLLASMDANSIYHSGSNYPYIPLIVSSQMVVIWRLVNDIAPQGNSIRVYDFLNNTCGEYTLAYEGEVPPGENRYGELNIVFNGTSSEEQIEINIIRQHDQAQYEFGMSYDSTSYCWCPIDNTFVGMHHSYGYESDYMPMYWKDKGFALLSDSDAAIYADLNEGQIISTITDFEPVYVGQDPSYLYELITIDDPSVIKTIECVGAVTEGSITSVNATGWWHMDPDPEYWWDPDMPQGCVYKVANLTDPDVGSYDMYVGFEMYILPHRIEENTEGQ